MAYHTRSFCPQCQVSHEARYVEESGQLWYDINCPRRSQRTLVSSDAALFAAIRNRAGFAALGPPPFEPQRRFYFIEITRACNFQCPICYADASGLDGAHLPLEEVLRRGRMVAADGGRWVSLTGGEPTCHPQLRQIITGLRRLGLAPLIITNGLRIAEEPGYLDQLRRAGLRKVQLQFDTLAPAVYHAMRGRHDPNEKLRAIEVIARAGLRLGLVATVCTWNLSEVGRLLELAVSNVPMVNTLILQSVLPVGRFPADLVTADREAIIYALVRQAGRFEIRPEDFWPLPQVAPWRGGVHPDCSAHLALAVTGSAARPIGRDVDLQSLYTQLGGNDGSPGVWNGTVRPLVSLFKATRRGKRIEVLGRIWSMRTGHGRKGMLLVSVGSYMHAPTRDEARLCRCSTCTVTAGGLSNVCERACRGETHPAPGSDVEVRL